MQKAYITELYEIMQKDSRVCSLLSDSGTDYDVMMFRDFPKQCYNFGISEQHKVGAASGMAALGKIPFIYTTGAFLAYRAYEFIRNDICFQKRNVKVMGMGTGMGSWSTLGGSHHTTEDIAALRALPNLTLLSAATPLEVKKCVYAAYELDGPVYLRLGMSGEEEIYSGDYEFKIGRNITLIDGNDYVVFSTGSIIGEVFKAVKKLNDEGFSMRLINIHTLKPFDTCGVIEAVRSVKKIFTVEEHNIYGGLGSAVSEAVTQEGVCVKLIKIGLNDRFADGYGKTNEVRAINGLDADGIYKNIKKVINGV